MFAQAPLAQVDGAVSRVSDTTWARLLGTRPPTYTISHAPPIDRPIDYCYPYPYSPVE